MGEQKFSRGEVIRFGWETFKSNIGFFIILLVIVWVVSAIFQVLMNFTRDATAVTVLIGIISWVVNAVLTMGIIKITLKFCDKQKPEFTDLYQYYPLTLKYLASTIVFGVIVAIGMLLLIVPGIICAIRLQLFSYFIVDKNQGPIEALKSSWEATKGSTGNLFILWLTFIGITLLGILALLVGLFAAIPTIMVAMAFVYRKLSGGAKVAA